MRHPARWVHRLLGEQRVLGSTMICVIPGLELKPWLEVTRNWLRGASVRRATVHETIAGDGTATTRYRSQVSLMSARTPRLDRADSLHQT